MNRFIPLLFAALSVLAFPALAKKPAPLPPAVMMHIDEAKDMCEPDFGTFQFDRENGLKIADLNNDGRKDYIVSSAGFQCSGAASLYGGSGGYGHNMIISQPGGDGTLYATDPAWILAYSFTIDDTKKPPQVSFHLRCPDGKDGTDTGEISWVWAKDKMVRAKPGKGCDK